MVFSTACQVAFFFLIKHCCLCFLMNSLDYSVQLCFSLCIICDRLLTTQQWIGLLTPLLHNGLALAFFMFLAFDSVLGLQLLLQSIFKPFLSWDAVPPESVFDWTWEIDSYLSNQNINNQSFPRKHWRLLQCQDGLLHLFTW